MLMLLVVSGQIGNCRNMSKYFNSETALRQNVPKEKAVVTLGGVVRPIKE